VDIFEKLVTERTPLGHYSNINAEGYFMFPKLEGSAWIFLKN
jgi:predicted RecA/RadA family phage recombinase